ncbi:MAG: glucosamine-6-phosphate deaminase, partial [Lentisphaeria bacterium]
KSNPKSVLGLATGRTMEALYAEMIALSKAENVSFKDCTSFNLDEYAGLAGDNVNSYRYYMNHHLLTKIDIDLANTNVPPGIGNIPEECAKYEQKIVDAGGIDIQLLGIGRTGHIAFNDPWSSFTSRTREVVLAEGTIQQNKPLFDNPDEMPYTAVTMGVGTIMDAKRNLMLITGAEKAEIAAKFIEGAMTHMISATALQMHEDCVVIIDEAAAALLQEKEYAKFVFTHDPKWAAYQNI